MSDVSDVSAGGVVGVVVARLDSARLAGKVLAPLGDRRVLDHVVDRARRCVHLDEVVVATTERELDDPLAEHAARRGVAVHRGPTDDVASRVIAAARSRGARWLVRLNGDSPFPDPSLIDEGVSLAAATEGCAIVTNLPGRTFPYGIAVEVVATGALASAHPRMSHADREHVTRSLYGQLEEHQIVTMTSPRPELSTIRLVVDTPEDLDVARRLVDALGPRAASAGWVEVAEAAAALGDVS